MSDKINTRCWDGRRAQGRARYSRTITCFLFTLAFCSVKCDSIGILSGGTYVDYFPLSNGNTWVYEPLFDASSKDTLQVLGEVGVNSHRYYRFGSRQHSQLIRKDGAGRVTLLHNDREFVYFDFTKKAGTTYQFRRTSSGQPYIVTVARNITIDSKAGTFQDCIRLYFDRPESVDEEFGFVFAPNVGIVKRIGAWINADLSSFELADNLKL